MGRFNDRFSGRRSNRSGDRRRSSRPVNMYPAVCDECGKPCQVPFQPSGDKPIYCSSCFEKQGNGGHSDRGDRRGRRDFGSERSEMYTAICDDCGNECQIPFRPTGDKPVYCSKCFEKRGNTHDNDRGHRSNNMSNDQLDMINKKLDQILEILDNKDF